VPIYEYQCQDCQAEFTALKAMAQSRAMGDCPECGEPSPRVLITPPALSSMLATARAAHEVNERSAHEPRSSATHTHSPGCGCGSGIGKSQAVRSADGKKAFPAKRPWMISH
jgi:putative FmdB family regulatory protein